MKTQIQQWGTHFGVYIPDTFVRERRIKPGTMAEVSIIENKLVIDFLKENPIEETFTLEQLLAGITAENLHQEFESGESVGKEVW